MNFLNCKKPLTWQFENSFAMYFEVLIEHVRCAVYMNLFIRKEGDVQKYWQD